MKKSRVHYVTVRIIFDKPVGVKRARDEFADAIHGTFYTNEIEDGDATIFKIKSVVATSGRG